MLGRSFSHYRVLDKLGEGGMGVVYLAEDTLLGRRVAIKFPNADPRFSERLLAEARTVSSLSHPAIAAVYDCGIHEGHPYVVMEYVEGENLSDRLKRGPLPPPRAIEIALETAAALSDAHYHNIVHRDIKPSNIRLGPRGAVKVLDFGIAKNLVTTRVSAAGAGASTETTEHTFVGTPRYMSPEQARADLVDARSDLFSLGAVLWECLTGQPAFSGRTHMDVLSRVLLDEVPPPSTLNPEVPAALDGICSRALAKDPGQRYQSAEALLGDLKAAQLPPVQPAPPGARRGRRRITILVAAVLLAATAVVAVRWLGRGRQPDPQALRWYQEGANAIHDGTYFKAAKALERAVSVDSGFALAHARLAEAFDELDDATRAGEEMLKAVAPDSFRRRLSGLDDLIVEAVRRSLANDPAGAAVLFRQLLNRVPESEKAGAWLDLGRAYEKAGQPKQALDSYRQAASRSPQYAAAFLHLGVLDRRAQRFAEADADFARAESLYQALSNTEGIVAVLYQRGVMANKRGDLERAGTLLDRALAMAGAAGSQQQQIETLLELSNVEYQKGNTGAAARHYAEATELARDSGLQLLTAVALLDLGGAHFLRGEAGQARSCFERALEYARRFHSPRTEARALLSLGSLEIQQADLAQGVQQVEGALRLYQQEGDAKEQSVALVLLGRARRDQGDYPGALRAFEKQLDLSNKTGDQAQRGMARDGAATVLEYQELLHEALAAYGQAYAASQERGDRLGAGYELASSGRVLASLGRSGEARDSLARAASFAGASGEYGELARTVEQYRCEIAMRERRFAAARVGARKLLAASAELGGAELVEINMVACSAGGLAACDTALDLARKSGMPRLASGALLSWAEAQLDTGKPSAAREAALSASAQFARGGQHESQARALLVCARAAQALGDLAGARPLAAQAAQSFDELFQNWTPEDRATYSSRPDVRHWRSQLAQIPTR